MFADVCTQSSYKLYTKKKIFHAWGFSGTAQEKQKHIMFLNPVLSSALSQKAFSLFVLNRAVAQDAES